MLRESGGASAVSLWFTLWAYEDAASATVSIGQKRLAALTGANVRTIQRTIDKLIEGGFLDRIKPGSKIHNRPAVYTLSPIPHLTRRPTPPPDTQTVSPPDISVPKGTVPVSSIQDSTSPINAAPDGGATRSARFAAPRSAPSPGTRESSAREKQSPIDWLKLTLGKAAEPMKSADLMALAKRAGFDHRDIENAILRSDSGVNWRNDQATKTSYYFLEG